MSNNKILEEIKAWLGNRLIPKEDADLLLDLVIQYGNQKEEEGEQIGEERGYEEGYNAGYVEGYNKGKEEGITEGRNQVISEIEYDPLISFEDKRSVLRRFGILV